VVGAATVISFRWKGSAAVKVLGVFRILTPNLSFNYMNSLALARKRTIPTERPPLVGEVSANFCG
jgi:hypothetical protein